MRAGFNFVFLLVASVSASAWFWGNYYDCVLKHAAEPGSMNHMSDFKILRTPWSEL